MNDYERRFWAKNSNGESTEPPEKTGGDLRKNVRISKEMDGALKSLREVILSENKDVVKATIKFEAFGVCTVEVETRAITRL